MIIAGKMKYIINKIYKLWNLHIQKVQKLDKLELRTQKHFHIVHILKLLPSINFFAKSFVRQNILFCRQRYCSVVREPIIILIGKNWYEEIYTN